MNYRYETHLHTNQASACGISPGKAYIQSYLDEGYSGIIVTDHFFNGNTSISYNLPWRERVRLLAQGYEEAKEYGDHLGLSVFFGFEYSYGQDEFLIYGLDKAWLLEHPQIMGWNHRTLYEEVDKEGGLVVQAHPFRERNYLSRINLHPYTVHAVEVINGENDDEFDRKARKYAKFYNLPMTSGSDIHTAKNVGVTTRGMSFERKLETIDDFITAVKNNQGYSIADDPLRSFVKPEDFAYLPIYLYDEEGRAKKIQAFEAWR